MTAAREIAPGIWSSPTRLGGLPTVGDTRLPVSAVAGYVRARRSRVDRERRRARERAAQRRAGSVSRRASEGHKSAAGDVASVHGASGDAGATSDATIDTGSPGDAAAVLTEAERDWRITLWQPAERRIHA